MVNETDLALLDLPTWQLDVMLGEALTAGEFGARDLTDIEKQSAARRWLTANLDRIRDAVCGSHVRTVLFGAETEKRNLLFAAVADALGTLRVFRFQFPFFLLGRSARRGEVRCPRMLHWLCLRSGWS